MAAEYTAKGTRNTASEMLDLAYEAEAQILRAGQRYGANGLNVMRAELDAVGKRIEYWTAKVNEENGYTSPAFTYADRRMS